MHKMMTGGAVVPAFGMVCTLIAESSPEALQTAHAARLAAWVP